MMKKLVLDVQFFLIFFNTHSLHPTFTSGVIILRKYINPCPVSLLLTFFTFSENVLRKGSVPELLFHGK